MVFEDVEVPVSVKVDASELKQLIKDFDGTAESAKRLEASTESVKNQMSGQRQAIIAVQQANRVNNFQMIEGLRLVRSTTSLFSNLNSVYQTLLLRQISTTQQTVAQREAFEKVSESIPDLFNGLGILGEKNQEVKGGFEDLLTSMNNVSSVEGEKLIAMAEASAKAQNLQGDALEYSNKKIKAMKDILAEVKLKEKQKEFEEFFGTFINIAQTATGLGTFAIALNATATGAKALNLALASSPYILAFLAALEVLNQAGVIDTPSITSLITEKTHKQIRDEPDISSINIPSRFANDPRFQNKTNITLNVQNLKVDDSGADLGGWLEKAYNLFETKKSQNIGGQ